MEKYINLQSKNNERVMMQPTSPYSYTAIIPSGNEHGGQHIPANSPNRTIVVTEFDGLNI